MASLFGCAIAPTVESRPSPLPRAWTQQASEQGVLAVGRVVRAEGVGDPFPRPSEFPGDSLAVPGEQTPSLRDALLKAAWPVIVVTAVVVAAPVVATESLSGESSNEPPASNPAHGVFRHPVQLAGTHQQVVMDEYRRFRVGDCVAIRATPAMLVPALPGACD
ncbi:MAG: hypothetical protein KDI82_00160 [Gammaproteobacteria bacterium]|nr:hypothetical protein [Gammaproteobacteria bacterium]